MTYAGLGQGLDLGISHGLGGAGVVEAPHRRTIRSTACAPRAVSATVCGPRSVRLEATA